MKSATGQVPPTGESVAELLARIGRQAALIREYRDREAAKNKAEQALRHVKIHLKISGCFRSLITTRAYCRIHSYLITIRLNTVPPMQAIRDALAGHAWTPLRALTPV